MRVIGLGAGGHAKVVIEILQLHKAYEVVELVDTKRELWGTKVLGIAVLGGDELLPLLYEKGVRHAFIGLGAVRDTTARRELYEKARRLGFELVSAVHPQAIISPSADMGHGPTIMAGAIINAASKVGDNVVINTGAIIEHDCTISDHTYVASGAQLASNVAVGEGSYIGLGASVRQCIHIGRNSIVGAGAVVVDDIPDNVVAVGVPARILKMRGE